MGRKKIYTDEEIRERRRECNRKWREANPEKVRECCRKWAAANPEKARECNRKQYLKRKAKKEAERNQ